jgi:hypothetical protein
MEHGTRITEARRRLRSVRYTVGIAAGIAFAGLALAARASHPGTSAHASTGSNATGQAAATETDATSSSFFDDGGATFDSSQSSSPDVESSGS